MIKLINITKRRKHYESSRNYNLVNWSFLNFDFIICSNGIIVNKKISHQEFISKYLNNNEYYIEDDVLYVGNA